MKERIKSNNRAFRKTIIQIDGL